MSVQPKGSPEQRKAFLMQLPTLMKELNEGMDLIGWPESAKKTFFGQLLPAHAESLKGQALRTLDYNLLAKQVDSALGEAMPDAAELPPPPANAAGAARRGQSCRASRPRRRSASAWWTRRGRLGRQGRHRPERRAGRRPTATSTSPACRKAERRRAVERQVAGRPCADRLRLPDAPGGQVAEGAAEPCQPGPQLLRLHARRAPQADDLDDRTACWCGCARPAACAPSRTPTCSSAPRRARARQLAALGDGAAACTEPRRSRRAASAPRHARSPPSGWTASALPLPAMSKAVPWSGLVRTKGRPSVTLTPCSTPRYLTGIRPWSCVIATTRSNSPGCPARGARA